jgi:hypothetical protein
MTEQELRYAEVLRRALDHYGRGATLDQAHRNFSRLLKRTITRGHFSQIVCLVRKNRDELGFTVSPCKKGYADDRRVFIIPVKKDGSFEINDDHRDHFDAGATSSMRTVTTQADVMAAQLAAMAANEPRRNRRERLADHADNFAFAARKLQRDLSAWQQERAA